MCCLAPNAVAPATPWTISIAIRRTGGPPAAPALADGAAAGAIASRNGSAIETPSPFRTVRRARCLPVRYIALLSCLRGRLHRVAGPPLERGAVDDTEDERREAEIRLRRAADDGAHRRHVVVLDTAS